MAVWFNELETDPTENNAFFLRYNIDFDSEPEKERKIYFYGLGTSVDNIEWIWEYSEFLLEEIPGLGLSPNIHFAWSVEGIYQAMSKNQITISELNSGEINADNYPGEIPNPMGASGMYKVEKVEIDFQGLEKIFNDNNGLWKLAFPPPGYEHMGPKPFKLEASQA